MKYTKVEFEKVDLVTIFSDGLCGDDVIIGYPDETKKLWEKMKTQMTDDELSNICFEEKLAIILLNGGKLDLIDEYADHAVGKHHIVDIEDFNRAACTKDGIHYIDEIMQGKDDFFTGWNFLQIVMFGEVIYG